MASRKIEDLTPELQEKVRDFKELCNQKGLDVLIYCTFRSPAEQAQLYAQGRTVEAIQKKATELLEVYGRADLADLLFALGPKSGSIVTMAGPGQSLHNYRLAFDGVPLRSGKPVWGTRKKDDLDLWILYGSLIEEIGLEWAGRWKKFREFPHAQLSGYSWKDLICSA